MILRIFSVAIHWGSFAAVASGDLLAHETWLHRFTAQVHRIQNNKMPYLVLFM